MHMCKLYAWIITDPYTVDKFIKEHRGLDYHLVVWPRKKHQPLEDFAMEKTSKDPILFGYS